MMGERAMQEEAEGITSQVFRNAPVPVDGIMRVPDLPGLGLELDLDFIRERDEV
jgi:L-alanine-DL-glutamate epimerase-like enolase superfamily enzyme